MNPPFRIFLSVRQEHKLTPDQARIHQNILNRLESAGFEPQRFFVSGLPAASAWHNDEVKAVLSRCQGAIILAYEKWHFQQGDQSQRFASGFRHFEGAMALAQELPTLVIAEPGLAQEGLLYRGGGTVIVEVQSPDDVLNNAGMFRRQFASWKDKVNERFHLFLGYSSGATPTAHALRDFLESNGVRVMDWQRDFGAGGTILEQIREAARRCLGGVFLFTQDDELADAQAFSKAVPRDNVVFEAGYFMHAKGDKRTLMIIESGVKIPADVGGQIYLNLQDRHNLGTIQDRVLKFVRDNL